MQESRLFRILYYLLDKGRATAPELAEKFEVSVKTIYRDVDTISSAGILFMLQQEETAVYNFLTVMFLINLSFPIKKNKKCYQVYKVFQPFSTQR